MATLTNHGGGCCGARHIHGFGGAAEGVADLKRIHAQDVQNLLYEVILSQAQCREYPALIAQLDRMGYVLTDRWIGAHGTPIARFSRARNRLPLLGNGVGFEWNGMVAGPNLQGAIADRGDVDANANAARDNHIGYRGGDLVVINSPASARNGQQHRIRVILRDWNTNVYTAHFRDDNDRDFAIVLTNLRRVNEAPALVVPPPLVPLRHPTVDDIPQAQALMQPLRGPEAPRYIFSTWHNVYADGRVGAGYDTIAAAQQAAPRCQTRRRRDIRSDGEVNWVNL